MNLKFPKSSLGSFATGIKTRTIPNLSGNKALRGSSSFQLPKLGGDVALSGSFRRAIERSTSPKQVRDSLVNSTDSIYMGGNTRSQFASAVNSANKATKDLLSVRLQKRYFPKGRIR
jgi:diphthamide biosynthesis methyltransferase